MRNSEFHRISFDPNGRQQVEGEEMDPSCRQQGLILVQGCNAVQGAKFRRIADMKISEVQPGVDQGQQRDDDPYQEFIEARPEWTDEQYRYPADRGNAGGKQEECIGCHIK